MSGNDLLSDADFDVATLDSIGQDIDTGSSRDDGSDLLDEVESDAVDVLIDDAMDVSGDVMADVATDVAADVVDVFDSVFDTGDDGLDAVCVPDCGTRVCGDDGCGGACGFCADGQYCDDGQCVSDPGIPIAAGTFWMGCNEELDPEPCGLAELPYHQVNLSAYVIDRHEVTVRAYAACVEAGACTLPGADGFCNWNVPGRERHPINCVTPPQASAYCEWAGGHLPTEAQWEYAARGTDERSYPWGEAQPDCTLAVMHVGEDGFGCGSSSTLEVCSRSPAGDSPFGLCDMGGNVWEWIRDQYDSGYYGWSPKDDPQGPVEGTGRLKRGGGMSSWYYSLRVALRIKGYDVDADYASGFRCAHDPEP